MNNFYKIKDIQNYLLSLNKDIKVGFVPTMGALHEGHLSLITKSGQENDITICSIFVNPSQFNDPDDYAKYPRTIDKDIELIKTTEPDVVFIPEVAEMYPAPGILLPDYELSGLDKVMEGKYRPGHFKGVVYIVSKFFEILKPDNAYFGLKDFQQFVIIKHIVNTLHLEAKNRQLINIIGCPIIRANDGLALSSRNQRLSPALRSIAPALYKSLIILKDNCKPGTVSFAEAKSLAIKYLEDYKEIKLDYLEIVDTGTLLPVKDTSYITHRISDIYAACIAAFLGEVRLIDNIIL